MKNGAKFLAGAAILASAACGGNQGKLQIRATAAPLSKGGTAAPFRIAEARGHYALGNVALALESFRKAARENPASADARAGIAACYDRMGRFDLSRRNYEAALAIAPGDPHLLNAFAASLDLQGLGPEAAAVRGEIAARLAADTVVRSSPPTVAEAPREAAMLSVVDAPAVPHSAPETTLPVGRTVTIALPPPRPPAEPLPAKTGAEPAQLSNVPTSPGATVPVGRSVTIALPPPRSVAPPPRAALKIGPRLERVSLGEVALITVAQPQWRRQTAARPAPQQAVRAASKRPAPRPPLEIRLLNAARVDKLAARTRSYLSGRGWREITIGDAALARPRSLIVYPAEKRAEAAKLASQFGFAMARRTDVRQVTILLGRDAADLRSLRAKG